MKILNTIKGLLLVSINVKIFDPNKIFNNKRIVIVGAADSAFEEENGEYINSFDYIIRVNKAPHSLTTEKTKYIGNRTDILFHSFYENSVSGGGPIDLDLYKSQGINFVINPNNNIKGWRVHLNYYKRKLKKHITYILPGKFYKQMTRNFLRWTPTVGYSALYSVLNAPFKELYITGFTFFKTPYANDYRDHFKNMDSNNEHIKKQGIHNPDLELKEFIKELKLAKIRNSNISMDSALSNIVDMQIKNIPYNDEK